MIVVQVRRDGIGPVAIRVSGHAASHGESDPDKSRVCAAVSMLLTTLAAYEKPHLTIRSESGMFEWVPRGPLSVSDMTRLEFVLQGLKILNQSAPEIVALAKW